MPFYRAQEPSQLASLGAVGHPKPRGGKAPSGITEELAEVGARSLTPGAHSLHLWSPTAGVSRRVLFAAASLCFVYLPLVSPLTDVFNTIPSEYEPGFKNPCWLGNATDGTPRRHCIPFYYLLGNWQSGVRDLQLRLELHPDVVRASNAAPHFWDERHPFEQYMRVYDQCALTTSPGPVQLRGRCVCPCQFDV